MYQEFRPDRRLAPWAECGWTRSGSATRSLRVMPDGCVDLFVYSILGVRDSSWPRRCLPQRLPVSAWRPCRTC
ncbi:MAG TPA: DUF6597 domain-containing transcriptional factor [Mycobacterium sp.]